jgi:aspartyl-tRNA(Asn)/glutamyl-tRNA(Gln) amidotransferase subunit A
MKESDRNRGPVSTRVAEALERIAALNPALNAFITVFEAAAMADAQVLDDELRQGRSRGPLHGHTISIKDLIDVKGVPTTAASRVRAGHIAGEDAEVVSRLREAGAVIIGKCNLHELALGTTSDESAFGPVHNPRDASRSPGGSSGGSAAAVAGGMGWASIGTDTGGSIRIPAAACGVVGLKPTFGEIPTTGVVPLSVSLDHVGPIARTVGDAWAIYTALAGAPSNPTFPEHAGQVRIGKLSGYFLEKLDTGVRHRFDEALDRLKAAGAIITDVHLGPTPDIATTYVNVALTEAFAFYAGLLEKAPDAFSKGTRERLQMGGRISREEYVKAQGDRALMRAAVDAALSGCDALALPTLPVPAQKIGATTVPIGPVEEPLRPLTLRLTQLFNLTGHPAISLPCEDTSEGLPCGFQLVGRRQETAGLLSIALKCETYVTPRAPSSSGHP